MLSKEVADRLPTTKVRGHMYLAENAKAYLGKAHLTGRIEAKDQTLVHLKEGSTWTLTQDSYVNDLVLDRGSRIFLNPTNQFGYFNSLSVNGNLSGKGYFRFSTNLAELAYNKLLLNGKVEGSHTISIVDSGVEPQLQRLENGLSGIRLVEIKSPEENSANFELENAYVDAGAYRYVLNTNFGFEKAGLAPTVKPQPDPEAMERPENSSVETFNPPTVFTEKPVMIDSRFSGASKIKFMSPDEPTTIESNDSSVLNGDKSASPTSSTTTINAVRAQGTQADMMSQYANAAVEGLATTQRVVSESFEQLAQHTVTTKAENSAWFKVQRSHLDSRSNDYRSKKYNSTLNQVGAELADKGVVAGIAYTENRLGKNHNFRSLGVYAKKQWDNGLFASMDAQVGRMKADSLRQKLARLGLTTGYDAKLGNTTLTPYAGFALTSFASTSYEDEGANIRLPNQKLMTYHAGLNVNHQFDFDAVKIKPFAGVHYVVGNKQQYVKINNATFSQKFDNRLTYQAGIEFNVRQFGIALSVGSTKGKELKRNNHIALKANWSW